MMARGLTSTLLLAPLREPAPGISHPNRDLCKIFHKGIAAPDTAFQPAVAVAPAPSAPLRVPQSGRLKSEEGGSA